MRPLRLFISSVQKEFAEERKALGAFLRGDALLRRFFETFLFEEAPAADRRADEVYLDEVERCDVYVGLFGNEYGFEDRNGRSPTHREFALATARRKHRLIFVKGSDDRGRDPKMQALIRAAGAQLVRRRFGSTAELIAAVYASLVDFLVAKDLIRTGPFDAAPCTGATMKDLSAERVRDFVRSARDSRGFPLPERAPMKDVLKHLSLLHDGRPTNAAVLLFGASPQRFLLSSQVKCCHFHGTRVQKPIPFYQVYKGTAFELVDQAVDFVLSKINLAVGTREHSTQAPVAYEMPPEVVREAIVNAVAHRDYTSAGSVQVMLFADRLEIWNPGTLPPSLTLPQLRRPHASVPGNPLVAEALYLTKYIERMGTGIGDMIERCRKAGLQGPAFALTDGFVTTIRRSSERAFESVSGQVTGQVTGQVDPWVLRALTACASKPLRSGEIQLATGLRHRETFQRNYLDHLLKERWLERTLPDKPRSSMQRYRLTIRGREFVRQLQSGEQPALAPTPGKYRGSTGEVRESPRVKSQGKGPDKYRTSDRTSRE